MIKVKSLAIVPLIATLSACSPSTGSQDVITQAYSAPGVVQIPPYTRTVFSSHNF